MILALPLAICYDVATLFDAKFQNGGGSKIQSWHELLLCFIEKIARPKDFVDLRGISLISCFAKWFMLCVLLLVSRVPRPRRWRPVCSFGFMKEKSVSDICGALTLLFAKASEWKDRAPLYLFDGDVWQAFDFLSPHLTNTVMQDAEWPTNIRANIIDANVDLHASTSIQGTDQVDFDFNSCLRIGSVEAPDIWKLVILSIFSEVSVLWEESGLGFTIDSMYDPHARVWRTNVVLTHFVWADNLSLLSNSLEGLKKMIQSLSDVLNSKGLFWKSSSLRFLTNRDDTSSSFIFSTMEPLQERVPMVVKHVPHLEVLGARIDAPLPTDWERPNRP